MQRSGDKLQRTRNITVFGMVWAALSLSPLLVSGFYGDDAIQSMTRGALAESGRSVFGQYVENMRFFAEYRLSLVQLFHWVFVLIPRLFIFKIYVFSLVLLNLFVFARWVRGMSNSAASYVLALLIPPLLFQFRAYGDPILVFHGVAQVNCLSLMLSLVLLVQYLNQGSRTARIGSIALYVLSLNTYEFVYPLFLLHFLTARHHPKVLSIKESCRKAAPYAISAFAFAALNVSTRFFFSGHNAGVDTAYKAAYTPSFSLGPYFLTLIREIVAPLPLSYYLFDPHSYFAKGHFGALPRYLIEVLILAGGAGSLLLWFMREKDCEPVVGAHRTTASSLYWVLCGLLLLIVPSAIIALSPNYQSQIVWGTAYTSVYMTYFGVTLLLITLLKNAKLNAPAQWLVAITMGVLAALNYSNNQIVVEELNVFWHYPRTVAEDALRNGLFRSVPDGAYLMTNNNFPWDIALFFRENIGLKLNQRRYEGADGHFFKSEFDGVGRRSLTVDDLKRIVSNRGNAVTAPGFKEAFFGTLRFEFKPSDPVWYFDYYGDSRDSGYAILGKVADLQMSNSVINGVTSESAAIYVRTPIWTGAYRSLHVSGQLLPRGGVGRPELFEYDENDLEVLGSGKGWKMFRITSPAPGSLVDLKSLNINSATKYIRPSQFWRPKSERDLRLGGKSGSILHLGFATEMGGSQVTLPPIELGPRFTIEGIVEPAKGVRQSRYAHIVGNHPGRGGHDGFVIQQDQDQQNVYKLTLGNGSAWQDVGALTLLAGKRSYFSVSVGPSGTRMFIDGKFFDSPIREMKNSDLPLSVGDLPDTHRPFKGWIHELKIENRQLSDEEVLKHWELSKRSG